MKLYIHNCSYSQVPIKRVGQNERVGWLGTRFAPQLISKFSTLLVYLTLPFFIFHPTGLFGHTLLWNLLKITTLLVYLALIV